MMEEMSNGTEHAKENKFEPNKKYSSDDEEKLIKWISSLTGSAPADSGQQVGSNLYKSGIIITFSLIGELALICHAVNSVLGSNTSDLRVEGHEIGAQ